MTTSTVLRTLQTKGFLQRKEHLTDTRAKTVELTENGTNTIKEAVKTVEAFDKDFFSVLGSKTGSFNEQLLNLLEKK
jgi:DNA-binding MarR family transcriptional regulator